MTETKMFYTQAWKQFNIYFRSVATITQKINYLSIIALGLIIAMIINPLSSFFYIPVIILLIPIVVAVINLMNKTATIPWISKSELLDTLHGTEPFPYEEYISDLFNSIDSLYTYKLFGRTCIRISVSSIIIAVITLVLLSVFA